MLPLAFLSGLVVGVVATWRWLVISTAEKDVCAMHDVARALGVESDGDWRAFAQRVVAVARQRQATHENVERVMRRIHDGFGDEADDET